MCVTSKTGAPIEDIEVSTTFRPRIFISEVAARTNPNERYIELYNTTLHTMTLFEMRIELYKDGSTTPVVVAIPEGLVIPQAVPGTMGTCQFTMVRNAAAFTAAFPGDTFDVELPGLDFDGTDAVALYFGDLLLDVWGVIGVDGAGEPWAYEGMSVEREVLVTTPQTEMSASEWIIGATFTPDIHEHP